MGQDCNSPSAPSMGLFNLDMAIHPNGQRASAYNTYLNKKLALSRQQHLTVCTGVVVSKLDVDEHAGLVRGVHIQSIDKNGQNTAYVQARHELIICSGAICTPQILLLSGIGPQSQLDALGIPVKKDLPVWTISSILKLLMANPCCIHNPPGWSQSTGSFQCCHHARVAQIRDAQFT